MSPRFLTRHPREIMSNFRGTRHTSRLFLCLLFKDDIIAKAINRLRVDKASDKLLKEQAKDMVMTEEELDYLAMLKVRARDKGRDDRNIEMALDMLADNEPLEKIIKYSHLSMEKVLELRDSQATFAAK